MAAHHEIKLEEFIVEHLTCSGWLEDEHGHCVRQLALCLWGRAGRGRGGAW